MIKSFFRFYAAGMIATAIAISNVPQGAYYKNDSRLRVNQISYAVLWPLGVLGAFTQRARR